ncbi:MAG TPA: hypothetical protein VK821_16960 [Dehalococcoidia bacterium]|nr:hypothetical protein [Dehalococcoidia bacterium]
MRRLPVILLPLVLALALAPRVLAGESGGAQTLEQALRGGAETGGSVYAGECSRTRAPQDAGKTCTKLFEERGPVRAYLVGQTFSEFRRWLFLEEGPAGWVIVASAPMDTRASPIVVPWPSVGAPSG